MSDIKKFLIIRLGAIGDLIHALPLADFIKEKYPNAQVDWVVGDKFVDIIKDNPLVDNYYVANLSKWRHGWFLPSTIKDIASLNKKLRDENYDFSIDAHGMFKSFIINAFCGAKNKIVYKDYRELASLGGNIKVEPKSKRHDPNYHVIKRQIDLMEGLGFSQDEINSYIPKATLPLSSSDTIEFIDALLKDLPSKPNIVFAPATTWQTKHWAEDNWKILYNELKDKVNILFTGTSSDIPLIKRITNNDPNAIILAGKTKLLQYIEVLRRARVVVSPDSSAAHISWALSSPIVITIFTSTSKNTYGPIGQISFPLNEPVCTPCHKKKCKNPICTVQTDAKEVLDVLNKIIKNISL